MWVAQTRQAICRALCEAKHNGTPARGVQNLQTRAANDRPDLFGSACTLHHHEISFLILLYANAYNLSIYGTAYKLSLYAIAY